MMPGPREDERELRSLRHEHRLERLRNRRLARQTRREEADKRELRRLSRKLVVVGAVLGVSLFLFFFYNFGMYVLMFFGKR